MVPMEQESIERLIAVFESAPLVVEVAGAAHGDYRAGLHESAGVRPLRNWRNEAQRPQLFLNSSVSSVLSQKLVE
jgi:hypothetical protein